MIGEHRRVRISPMWPSSPSMIGLAELLRATEGWQNQGACREVGWSHFDPADEGERARPYPPRARVAATVCADCPVIKQCRSWARRHHGLGVWGGWWFSGEGRDHRGVPIALPTKKDAA